MTTEKYSPNWLLQKIESSKTEAHKLLHIIEFQNQLINAQKQGYALPIDSVSESLPSDIEVGKAVSELSKIAYKHKKNEIQ